MKKEKKRPKFKLIYKILIILAVFVGSLIYFSSDITETIFGSDVKTVGMRGATLPVITMEVDGKRINTLNGYVANLDEMIVRESITPISVDRSFTIKINEHESNVKKLKYEVFNLEKSLVESGNFTVLDTDEKEKTVRIELLEKLESGTEYVLRVTLITNESKRIYYYTRLKMYEDGKLGEKLGFVQYFHSTLLNKFGNRAQELESYLEPKWGVDNSDFSHVDIHSSLGMISYGNLDPTIVYEMTPTVTEFYDTMASVYQKFIVSVETDEGPEYYLVKEKFRFNYTEKRVYLYNYERDMDEFFDINKMDPVKREFKLGITQNKNNQVMASPDGKYMAFVYNRELVVYDIENNKASMAFSFRDSTIDYEREYYDSYDVRLLRCNNNGTVDFYVYGYMNRGEYEGRVGIVLYRFNKELNANEERLYLPINSSYQVLLSDMTDFAFLTEYESFYISIFDNIYCYDLITGELNLVASDVPEENMVYCREENYIAWQNSSNPLMADKISILHLDTGETYLVSMPNGYVKLYGSINNNLIYGFSKSADVARKNDGSITLPSYMLTIADSEGKSLKTYSSRDCYIRDVEIGDNILTIKRVKKESADPVTYADIEDDTILNKLSSEAKNADIIKHVTDRMLTEYYVTIPGSEEIPAVPKIIGARNVVINYETTVRVTEPEERDSCYYAYSFGEIVKASKKAAEAVAAADEHVGTVINRLGKLIWERGVKSAKREITGLKAVQAGDGYSSMQAAIKMLILYRNLETDTKSFNYARESAYNWMNRSLKPSIVDMTGATLDEVLYFVYKKRPVIALKSNGDACVISAYDALSVTYYEPSKGRSMKMGMETASNEFAKAGNIFFTYVE